MTDEHIAAAEAASVEDRLAALDAKRTARRAVNGAAAKTQRLEDLEAIDAIEEALFDSNVAQIEVPYTPGLPVLVAVRCPKPVEMARYRSDVRGHNGDNGDPVKAAERIGQICLVYPPKDDPRGEQLFAARSGLLVQVGTAALRLSSGRAEADAKG